MKRIIHISDTHFGTEVPRVEAAFWQSVAELQPNLVIHSGDVTQRALKREFSRAEDFFAKFQAIPIVVVPGNHDIPLWDLPTRLLRPYAAFKRTFSTLEPSYEDDDTIILALNTTRPWRHKHGVVSQAQVERVCARMRDAKPGQLRIVVAHHPLFIPTPHEPYNQVRGNVFAKRRWFETGVDLIMGGHIHLPYFVPLPSSSTEVRRECWIAQAGTATSRRTRRGLPNSFNVIDRHPTSYTLERWDFDHQTGRFHLGTSVDVPLRRSTHDERRERAVE